MNKKVLYIFTFIIILIYIIQNFALAKDASLKDEESENDITNKENIVEVSYKTHVQDIGWQEWKENGELSGTEGESKRLEGISIKINNSDSIRIKYQTHIQNIGWQNWKYDGEISGTEGENKRLEGIKIELENTEKYSIEYRAHVQDIGWQAWKKDGEMAGTEGQSLRLEAIEIKIIERKIGITYQTHIQDIGWQEWKKDGELSGTEGQGKRLEAIKIQLNSYPNLKIKYKVHVQNIGWQDWKQNGEMAGTSERSLRLEAIVMELEKSNDFSIQYRVYVENIGWQDWRDEGQIAGTSGQSLRLEGIQIRVIKKVKKARICIDTPKEILTINSPKELEISGWKMSNVSNDELQIFIDDSEKAINKDLIKYKKRQDVIDLVKEYGKEMLKHGMSIKGLTLEEILNKDFKNYRINDEMIGIGQILITDFAPIKKKIPEIVEFLNQKAHKEGYKVLTLFVTNFFEKISYCIYNESADDILLASFKLEEIHQGIKMDGIISRKIQILPNIMDTLDR